MRVVAIGALGHEGGLPFAPDCFLFLSVPYPYIVDEDEGLEFLRCPGDNNTGTIFSVGEGELYEPGLFLYQRGERLMMHEYSVAEGDLVANVPVADIDSVSDRAPLNWMAYFAKPDSDSS